MIIFGSRSNLVQGGSTGLHHCVNCDRKTVFIETYMWRHGHIFWIPMLSWNKERRSLCARCGTEDQLGFAASGRPARWNEVIPWMHRWGWVLPTSAIAIYVVAAAN